MPYSDPIVHTDAASGNTNDVTTPALDTTTADFLVAMVGLYSGAGSGGDPVDGDVTDSKGNNWEFLVLRQTAGLFTTVALYWCRPTTVGSGHTVTFTRSATFPAIAVAAFSGSAVSPADETFGDNGGSGTDIGSGFVTPSADHSLLITGVATGSPVAIDGVAAADGFTVIETVDYVNGVNIGVGMAYKLLPVAALTGTTWELSTSTDRSALIASFLSAAPANDAKIIFRNANA